MSAPEEAAGETVACPHCYQYLQVPAAAAPPPKPKKKKKKERKAEPPPLPPSSGSAGPPPLPARATPPAKTGGGNPPPLPPQVTAPPLEASRSESASRPAQASHPVCCASTESETGPTHNTSSFCPSSSIFSPPLRRHLFRLDHLPMQLRPFLFRLQLGSPQWHRWPRTPHRLRHPPHVHLALSFHRQWHKSAAKSGNS